MNTNDLTYLLNKPHAINDKQTMALEIILQQFPFFQSARALHLKGLYNQESFRYNYELKKTAAHTHDRSILFDFISSNSIDCIIGYSITSIYNLFFSNLTEIFLKKLVLYNVLRISLRSLFSI